MACSKALQAKIFGFNISQTFLKHFGKVEALEYARKSTVKEFKQ